MQELIERNKKPSGMAYPVTTGNNEPLGSGNNGSGSGPPRVGDKTQPIPVVLTLSTIIKLIAGIMGPLILGVSTILCFYWKAHWQAQQHIGDQSIHFSSQEKGKFETKEESKIAHKELLDNLKSHVDLRYREVAVKQKEDIQQLGEELKSQQQASFQRVLAELRKTGETTKKIFDQNQKKSSKLSSATKSAK